MKISVQNLSVSLESNQNIGLLQHFELFEREIAAWTGPSGVGKSTLARALLSRISSYDLSSYSIEGNVNISSSESVGYLPQKEGLVPWSKLESFYKSIATIDNDSFKEILDTLDISHLLTRYPTQLSGGEYQRCSLAATLLRPASIMIADEPLTQVDYSLKIKILEYLKKTLIQRGTAAIIISHDVDLLSFFAEKFVFFETNNFKTSENKRLGKQEIMEWDRFTKSNEYFERRTLILDKIKKL